MKILATLLILVLFIISMMILTLNLISKKKLIDREKSSPFECGFDPQTSARLPFSLQFFIIAVIFLIFDVEIVLLLPSVTALTTSNPTNLSFIIIFFIIILILGLFHEWNQGALDWVL
nr:NADH dehydrogenase subunit 3 [Sarmydus sp. N117]